MDLANRYTYPFHAYVLVYTRVDEKCPDRCAVLGEIVCWSQLGEIVD